MPLPSSKLCTTALAALLLAPPAPTAAQPKESPRPTAADFDKLHQLIKRQPGESRWMEVDWHPSVWEARQKAAREGKPLFIWAGSGGAPSAGC